LEQSSLIEELLKKHGMTDAKPQQTPLAQDHGYFDDGPTATMTATELREVVGSLLWLAGSTRPDITHAVNLTARFLTKATEHHVHGVKRILRYLRGTSHVGLLIAPTTTTSPVIAADIRPEVFCDADWAGDKTNRRSTSGSVLRVNGCAVAWNAKQQPIVALSTMEAEYVAASTGMQECMWISQLLTEIGLSQDGSVQLWCDNQSAIKSMENDMSKARSKHIDIRYHYIREQVRSERIKVGYCETGKMLADIFTKPLPSVTFERLKPLLGVVPRPLTQPK
jgi:hypothetical protein